MLLLKNPATLATAALVLTLAGTGIAGVASTRAAFTDTATAGSATFTTGTVDLSVQVVAANGDCTTGSFADTGSIGAIFTSTSKPGDLTQKAICVKNVGTLDVNYTMAAPTISSETGSTNLKTTMKVRISKAATNTSTCEAGITAAGADATLSSDSNVANAATVAAVTIGSNQALTAGSTHKLCFHFNLPSGTSDDIDSVGSIQGASFSAAFAFAGVNQ